MAQWNFPEMSLYTLLEPQFSQLSPRVTSRSFGLETCRDCGPTGLHIFINFKSCCWASLMAQWLGICLPMQGTQFRALVQEDLTCRRATKPMRHNYWACAPETTSHNCWAHKPQLLSPRATTTEARMPRAHAPQQEKPPQREAWAQQRRVAPTPCN